MKNLIFLMAILGLLIPIDVFSKENNQIKQLAIIHGLEISELPVSEIVAIEKIGVIEISTTSLSTSLYSFSGCRGNWVHQGEGCMHCYPSPYGVFHCCAGDTKQCPISD